MSMPNASSGPWRRQHRSPRAAASHADDHSRSPCGAMAEWATLRVTQPTRGRNWRGSPIRLATGAADARARRRPRAGRRSRPRAPAPIWSPRSTAPASSGWSSRSPPSARATPCSARRAASAAGTTGVRWVVDPIDGTVNFVLGIPAYAVSVAAEVDGAVVAGAVCNPVTRRAVPRRPAAAGRCSATPAGRTARRSPLDRAVIGTGFGYDRERCASGRDGSPPACCHGSRDMRRIGSAALDLCAVAAGRLDAYFEAGLNPWDYAAGALDRRGGGVRGQRAARPTPGAGAGRRGGGPRDLAATVSRCSTNWRRPRARRAAGDRLSRPVVDSGCDALGRAGA